MANPQRQSEQAPEKCAASTRKGAETRLVSDNFKYGPAVAAPRGMLREIERRWAAPFVSSDKWSLRQTAAFCLVTCGSFWALAIFAVVRGLG